MLRPQLQHSVAESVLRALWVQVSIDSSLERLQSQIQALL